MNCSNKCGKTCHDKSCQRYYNNNAQTIEVGGATQLVIKGNKVAIFDFFSIFIKPLIFCNKKIAYKSSYSNCLFDF